MRYIDADALIKKIYPMGIGDGKYTINAKAVKLAIDNAPTADVVPKSEVKRVYYNLQAVLEERAETKQEIAREIFEEIEEHIEVSSLCSLDIEEVKGILAKLKYKYTESENG
jgi:hypothetical protein